MAFQIHGDSGDWVRAARIAARSVAASALVEDGNEWAVVTGPNGCWIGEATATTYITTQGRRHDA